MKSRRGEAPQAECTRTQGTRSGSCWLAGWEREGEEGQQGGWLVPAVAWSLRWLFPSTGLVPAVAWSLWCLIWAAGHSGRKHPLAPETFPRLSPCLRLQERANAAGTGGAEGTSEKGHLEVQLQRGCRHPLAHPGARATLLWTMTWFGWDGKGMSVVWHCDHQSHVSSSALRRAALVAPSSWHEAAATL